MLESVWVEFMATCSVNCQVILSCESTKRMELIMKGLQGKKSLYLRPNLPPFPNLLDHVFKLFSRPADDSSLLRIDFNKPSQSYIFYLQFFIAHHQPRKILDGNKIREVFFGLCDGWYSSCYIKKVQQHHLIEVKLLLQNQGELLKRGQLKRPYTGLHDCFKRIFKEEGFFSFWRGNQVTVIRYFPTQCCRRLILHSKVPTKVYLDGRRREMGI
ncbi:hypothetical protein L1987_47302 [Smallanthus sonchifolius]|uniref:Uncharacterized protein n=1 Tax=Smallanthus sonchifolius TaxID=185202 RepID=A0ACB9G277_9ASTR|nr:hypothetical protein L1987_47302 [Smallanthus sonchifolius]